MSDTQNVIKVIIHSLRRIGVSGSVTNGMSHAVIAADPEFFEEIDALGCECFIADALYCGQPESPGLWIADFLVADGADADIRDWTAMQASGWVRLTATQADALAQGKLFAEVVAA